MAINVEKSIDSPKIVLDEDKSIFLIEGHSYPSDAFKTYSVVLNWLTDVFSKVKKQLVCQFKFKMLSSASRKMVYEIISELEREGSADNSIQIHWYYENYDEDMLEIGEYFAETSKLPFKFFQME